MVKKSPPAQNSKKRKRKQSNIEFLKSIQVPLNNRFQPLDEDENNIAEGDSSPLKHTISPLVITDHNSDVSKITKELKINCQLKLLSVGRKIICESIDDKKKLSDFLVEKKINFYSHPENDSKLFKVVLSGLPELSLNTITDSLKTQHNVTPIKIIMFNTNSPNKLYLCHFNKNEVSLKSLNTIKVVYHHIIKWMPYNPKHKGPTQCYQCCMYGHGASTCNRYAACLLCAGNHLSKNCTLPNTDNPVFKCYNCISANLPHDHKATDIGCPFRAKYELARNNAKAKNINKPSTKPQNSSGPYKSKYVIAPTPPPLTKTFASQASTSSQPSQARTQRQTSSSSQYTQQTRNQNNSDESNNLFSMDELTDILLNSIDELQKCNSKLDQLRVIANILRNVCK